MGFGRIWGHPWGEGVPGGDRSGASGHRNTSQRRLRRVALAVAPTPEGPTLVRKARAVLAQVEGRTDAAPRPTPAPGTTGGDVPPARTSEGPRSRSRDRRRDGRDPTGRLGVKKVDITPLVPSEVTT